MSRPKSPSSRSVTSIGAYSRHRCYATADTKPVDRKIYDQSPIDCSQPPIFPQDCRDRTLCVKGAILHDCQNYLGGGSSLGGSEKNRGTVITSLQLAFRKHDRNFTPFTIHSLSHYKYTPGYKPISYSLRLSQSGICGRQRPQK